MKATLAFVPHAGRRRALRAAGAALACVVVRPAAAQVPDLRAAITAHVKEKSAMPRESSEP